MGWASDCPGTTGQQIRQDERGVPGMGQNHAGPDRWRDELAGNSGHVGRVYARVAEDRPKFGQAKDHRAVYPDCQQHILPALGKYKLKDLRPDRIQAFYNWKLEQGASQRTVVMIHNVLHHALRRALQLGLVTRNSADAVIKPKLKRTEMKVLDEIQVRSLLMAAKGSRMEAFLQLAITTGMREGELIGLKWADLDWTGRKIHIQRQVQRIKKQGLVFSSPKTAKSRRVVAIGAATIEKLREQLERQQLERMFASTKWVENDLIFANRIGKPMEPANVLKLFKELLVKANLPDIRFHDLRHTAATLMLLQEVHPKIVQERLGHSDISLTLNTYSHVLPSMQEDAAEKMDKLVTLTEVGKELQKKKVTR